MPRIAAKTEDFEFISWADALEEYLDKSTYAESTELFWRYIIGALSEWAVKKKIKLRDLSKDDMITYRKARESGEASSVGKKCNPTTLRHDTICAKKFYQWAKKYYGPRYGFVKDTINAAEGGLGLPDKVDINVHVPSFDDVKKVVKAIKRKHELETNPNCTLTSDSRKTLKRRDTAILLVQVRAGLRVGETCRLLKADVDMEARTIYISKSKTGKARTVAFGDELHKALKDWLAVRPKVNSPYFFMSNRAKMLTRTAIYQAMRRYQEIAKVHKHSVHSLRHRACTDIISLGGDLIAARDTLGHKSLETTNLYADTTTEKMRVAVTKVEEAEPLLDEDKPVRKKAKKQEEELSGRVF